MLSCCHNPPLSDSERDFRSHNLVIADWERWPFASLKKKKKNASPSSFFPQFPLLHHHLLQAFDQSKPNPASCCSATANQSSWCSRVCISGGVKVGGRGGAGWGADIKRWWATKYWGSHDTHKQVHFYLQTDPKIYFPSYLKSVFEVVCDESVTLSNKGKKGKGGKVWREERRGENKEGGHTEEELYIIIQLEFLQQNKTWYI